MITIIENKWIRFELQRGVYLRLFDLLTFELGWFDQEPMLIGIEFLKLMDNGGFDNTFFFTIIRLQIIKLSLNVHVSGGVYNG